MMRLRVRLPDSIPGAESVCRWVALDTQGHAVSGGEDPPALMPGGARIELIAPASRVLLVQVRLPRHNRQRLRQILPFAIEDRITVEPERVHAALGPQLADGTHAVAIVDRDWLTEWLAAFARAGRTPASVQAETVLAPFEPPAWTIVWRGSEGFLRTGVAAGMALDAAPDAPPMLLRLALDEARAGGNVPERIVILAEAFDQPDLDAWSVRLGVPCSGAQPWDWTRAGESPFELLQGDFAPSDGTSEMVARFRPALALLAMIVVLQVIATGTHWALLSYEKAKLQSEMRTLFRAAFPAAQAIVDPPLQMRRQLEALRRAAGVMQRDDFLPLLARAAPSLGAAAGGHITGLTYERDKLLVDLELASRAEAEALLQRLQIGAPTVALQAVNPRGQGVQARFVITLGRGA